MKWMIASDLHGSAEACRKMLERYQKEKADRLMLLGDLLYHGPRNELPTEYQPKEVIRMLNAVKEELLCVRGNCDSEVDQMVLEFPILADYAILQMGERTVFATHGHRWNRDCMPPMKSGDVLLHGHTHIAEYGEKGNNIILNPGSVSIPKANTEKSYIIWEGNRIMWKDMEGKCLKEAEI